MHTLWVSSWLSVIAVSAMAGAPSPPTAHETSPVRVAKVEPARLVVEIDVNPSGKVTDVRTAVRKGVNLDLAQCIDTVANRLPAQPDQDATLAFQITFKK